MRLNTNGSLIEPNNNYNKHERKESTMTNAKDGPSELLNSSDSNCNTNTIENKTSNNSNNTHSEEEEEEEVDNNNVIE